MGGLLFGYDWVVIGGAKPFYELFFGISDSPLLQGVAMTTALVGCLVGAMVAGSAADRYGRKPLLMFSAVLFTVSAVATGCKPFQGTLPFPPLFTASRCPPPSAEEVCLGRSGSNDIQSFAYFPRYH